MICTLSGGPTIPALEVSLYSEKCSYVIWIQTGFQAWRFILYLILYNPWFFLWDYFFSYSVTPQESFNRFGVETCAHHSNLYVTISEEILFQKPLCCDAPVGTFTVLLHLTRLALSPPPPLKIPLPFTLHCPSALFWCSHDIIGTSLFPLSAHISTMASPINCTQGLVSH